MNLKKKYKKKHPKPKNPDPTFPTLLPFSPFPSPSSFPTAPPLPPSLPPAPSPLCSSLSFSHCRLITNILSLKNSGGMLHLTVLHVYTICFQERLASNCIYTLNLTLFHYSSLFHGRLLLQSLLLSSLFHGRQRQQQKRFGFSGF